MKTSKSLIILSIFSGLLLASTAVSNEAGNYRKGLYYYKNTCKKCHTLTEVGDGKTKQSHEKCISEKEWIADFQSKKFDMVGCKEIEKELCLENLKHVYKYLHTPSEEEPDATNCRVISVNKVNYNK